MNSQPPIKDYLDPLLRFFFFLGQTWREKYRMISIHFLLIPIEWIAAYSMNL